MLRHVLGPTRYFQFFSSVILTIEDTMFPIPTIRGNGNPTLHGTNDQEDYKERDASEEELRQGWTHNNSPNVYKIKSIIDRTAGSTNLAEAALEVAGQVAGTSVSTSPLPYSTMASQCEALGIGMRKKLSSWLNRENHSKRAADKLFPAFPADRLLAVREVTTEDGPVQGGAMAVDPCLALRLPPALVHGHVLLEYERKVQVIDIVPGEERHGLYLGSQGCATTIKETEGGWVVWPIWLLR